MKERGQKVLSVIPIDLDGYLFSGDWRSGKEREVKSRLVANFQEWKDDRSAFDAQVDRLVRSLRADGAARESPPPTKL
jgi:hypothetical protein